MVDVMTPCASHLPLVKLIATGGTIAMKYNAAGASVPAIDGDDLLEAVPAIADLASVEVDNFSNIPSGYMSPQHWLALYQHVQEALANDDIEAVIISHGTDSLEETAFFLDLTLSSDKPVIMVGAQHNAASEEGDGPANLLDAVRVAVSQSARGCGVLVVMNHKILTARDVLKVHTRNRVGFDAYEYQKAGVIDQGSVRFDCADNSKGLDQSRQTVVLEDKTLAANQLPRVDIIAMYAGAEGDLITAAVAAGAQGLVIQALGAGNVNQGMYAAIQAAIGSGVAVVISTRVPHGGVMPAYGYEGGGKTLVDCGALLSGGLSPQKARILLMLGLQSGRDLAGLF